MSERSEESPVREATSKTFVDSFVDSGLVSGPEPVSESGDSDLPRDKCDVSMKIDSGLDLGLDSGLTDSFSDLNIRNDLSDESPGSQTAVPQSLNIVQAEEEPWQIYFRQDENGDTQLHIAIVHGITDAVLALLHMCPHPALLDIRNDSGRAAIHLAVLTSQPHIARRLLIAGAKVNTKDADGNTALHLASRNGDLLCLRALTAPLAPLPGNLAYLQSTRVRTLPQALDQKNYDGETCVHLAALGGHVDILRHLVWFGADINARENKSGRSALHFAIERQDQILLSYLLTECPYISLNARTYSGHTALQLGNEQFRDLLIKGGYVRQEDESDIESETESDDEDYELQYGNSSWMRAAEAINVA